MSDTPPESPGPRKRRAAPLVWLTVFTLTLPMLSALAMINKSLQHAVTDFGAWVRDNLPWTAGAFVLVFIPAVAFAVVPTFSMSLLAGWSMGVVIGFPLAMTCITLGSLIAYFLARRLAGDRALAILRDHPRWARVHAALLQQNFAREFWIILLLRLPPHSPFAFMNAALASMRVAFPSYLLGTVLGVAPRTLAVVYVGSRLVEFDINHPDKAVFLIASIVATLIAIVLLGVFAKRELARVT